MSSNRDKDDSSHKATSAVPLSPSTIKRRKCIEKKLNEHRQEKLKRKLPVNLQLLNYAQEDIRIKRCLVEQIDKMDKQYAEFVADMSKNLEKLSESVREGF